MGKGRAEVPRGATQTESLDLDMQPRGLGGHIKGKGHRKGAARDTAREGITHEEAPTVPSFFFSPLHVPEMNLIHLFWEKSLLHAEYWLPGCMFCVRFVNSEKYFPFSPKVFMETKMSSLPDVFPLLVTYCCRVMHDFILSLPADNLQTFCFPQVPVSPVAMGHKASCLCWMPDRNLRFCSLFDAAELFRWETPLNSKGSNKKHKS